MFGRVDTRSTDTAVAAFADRWGTSGLTVPAASYLQLPNPRLALANAPVGTAEPVAPALAIASASVSAAADAVTSEPAPAETTFVLASASTIEMSDGKGPVLDSVTTPAPASRGKLVSLFRPAAPDEKEDLKPAPRLVELVDECLVLETCIDEYLFALYERTPKIDTNKLVERYKATIKRKGKTRTVTKTRTKYVTGDFTWKDPIAAQRRGMSLKQYVIGGMDRAFKLQLFRAMRTADAAGHMPGITSAFRDDYRQAIAVGTKAAADSSFHGGSRRGGYGHGMAVDVVSVKGDNRAQRWVSTSEFWKWIDQNERELGVGRPYLHRDPPHVVPIDGKEFIAKRGGRSATKVATLGGKKARTAKADKKIAATKRHAKIAQAVKPEAKPQARSAPAVKPEPKAAKAAPAVKPQPKAAKVEPKKRQVGASTEPTTRAKPTKSKVSALQDRTTVQR